MLGISFRSSAGPRIPHPAPKRLVSPVLNPGLTNKRGSSGCAKLYSQSGLELGANCTSIPPSFFEFRESRASEGLSPRWFLMPWDSAEEQTPSRASLARRRPLTWRAPMPGSSYLSATHLSNYGRLACTVPPGVRTKWSTLMTT